MGINIRQLTATKDAIPIPDESEKAGILKLKVGVLKKLML